MLINKPKAIYALLPAAKLYNIINAQTSQLLKITT
jgi:hypothetical protein